MPWGRVGKARAHRVHANAASLQVHRPCPRERTDRGFGGAINTPVGQPFTGDDGRIQDDRGTLRHQRKRLLHREKHALHVAVKERVVILRSYLAQGGDRRDAGIRKHNIEPALLPLDMCEQAIKVAKVRHVSLYAGYISSDLLYRRGQFGITTPRDEDMRAFAHKPLRRRKANAAIATGNECDFSLKPVHVFDSSDKNCQIARTTLPKGRASTRSRRASAWCNGAPVVDDLAYVGA